jgi:hypothetical protein
MEAVFLLPGAPKAVPKAARERDGNEGTAVITKAFECSGVGRSVKHGPPE